MTEHPVMPFFFGANMKNDQQNTSHPAQPEPDMVGQDEIAAAAGPGKGSSDYGVSESDSPQRPTRATRRRKDTGKLHARHHGVLSRNPLESLLRLGENPRHLRKIKKMLRAELKPVGIIGEILFDIGWSAYLRCVLISRVETHLFIPVDRGDSERMPELKKMELPTLVFPEAGATNYGFSDDLMKHLETALRYDAHYSRQFFAAVRLLVAMQTGGLAGLLECL
jgi:hypothetical protein